MPNDNVLTAEARATIMDACQSISRRADEIKESNTSADGTWGDAEDKAFYDAELRLLARLVGLLNDSGQSEPETATVARIEQLRKALFESRDAMRVMSNWVKKSDPAGHSWAVRMVDRANAALNGEPEPRSEVMEAGRRYPDVMTAELRDVLDRPNFWCGPIAHEMRAAGADIKTKAEDEQAHVLHWLVKLVLDHGVEWQKVAAGELRAIRDKADAARTGASTSALDAYKVAPVTLLEQQKRSIAERHFQGAPDVCRALKCIDEACAEMLTTARTGASS